jgi:NAD(P)-dependent dehydrogenase (short-subunit alcohol dehydrogenase family)
MIAPTTPRTTISRFSGKSICITGAASGLGRSVALRVAEEGASVFGLDLDVAGLSETAGLVKARGGHMGSRSCDVTDRADCQAGIAAALETFGRLDSQINCAGINRFSRFLDISSEEWRRILEVNLTGTFHACQAALPALLETSGNIVNIASTAGFLGQSYTVAYAASKGGVVQLTRSLAVEYGKTALRVNAVAPGGIDTPMNEDLGMTDEMEWSMIERYAGLRGMAQADEIASVVAFLASDEAKWVHGAIVACDGGASVG